MVTPLAEHELSDIVHSWKSFTSKAINKLMGRAGTFWQKEPFDHIVRSPDSLERIDAYILANPEGLEPGTFELSENLQKRRDAASTLAASDASVDAASRRVSSQPTVEQIALVEREQMAAALKPFHDPNLRNAILAVRLPRPTPPLPPA